MKSQITNISIQITWALRLMRYPFLSQTPEAASEMDLTQARRVNLERVDLPNTE